MKKTSLIHVWKAKFSRFYICHDICIGSSRCRSHHRTLTAWLCDVVDTNFIRALHPNIRCAIPITTQVIFRKISRDPLLPIWFPLGEAYSSIVVKKTSSIPYLEGKFLKVLHLPRHLNRQFLMSRPSRYLNSVVMRRN
jgi:hypothetical protein